MRSNYKMEVASRTLCTTCTTYELAGMFTKCLNPYIWVYVITSLICHGLLETKQHLKLAQSLAPRTVHTGFGFVNTFNGSWEIHLFHWLAWVPRRCHWLRALSVTRLLSRNSRYCRGVLSAEASQLSLVRAPVNQRRLAVGLGFAGKSFPLGRTCLTVTGWERLSLRGQLPPPSIQIQGRKEELLEPHVSLPVCSKTALLCDFLGLFSCFRGCTKVRLGTLGSVAGVSGGAGLRRERWCEWFRKWSVAAKKGEGGDFFPVR